MSDEWSGWGEVMARPKAREFVGMVKQRCERNREKQSNWVVVHRKETEHFGFQGRRDYYIIGGDFTEKIKNKPQSKLDPCITNSAQLDSLLSLLRERESNRSFPLKLDLCKSLPFLFYLSVCVVCCSESTTDTYTFPQNALALPTRVKTHISMKIAAKCHIIDLTKYHIWTKTLII